MGDQHSQHPGAGNSVNSIGDGEGPAIQIDSQTLIKSSIATQTHLTKRSSQQTEGLPKKSERKGNEENGKEDVAKSESVQKEAVQKEEQVIQQRKKDEKPPQKP